MKEKKSYKSLIIILSILIPVVVSVLFFLPKAESSLFLFLPKLNAIINGSTFLVLLAAFSAIKSKKVVLHKRLMLTAVGLSVVFLVSYVLYHATSESQKYVGEGLLRGVYFFILISHILLAIAIVPLVLVTLNKALLERFDKHRKIARITFPIWLYVTFTGVLVYLFLNF